MNEREQEEKDVERDESVRDLDVPEDEAGVIQGGFNPQPDPPAKTDLKK